MHGPNPGKKFVQLQITTAHTLPPMTRPWLLPDKQPWHSTHHKQKLPLLLQRLSIITRTYFNALLTEGPSRHSRDLSRPCASLSRTEVPKTARCNAWVSSVHKCAGLPKSGWAPTNCLSGPRGTERTGSVEVGRGGVREHQLEVKELARNSWQTWRTKTG